MPPRSKAMPTAHGLIVYSASMCRPIQIGNAIINTFQGGHKHGHAHSNEDMEAITSQITGDVAMHSPEEWTHQGNTSLNPNNPWGLGSLIENFRIVSLVLYFLTCFASNYCYRGRFEGQKDG